MSLQSPGPRSSYHQSPRPPAAPANAWLVMILLVLVGVLLFQILGGFRSSPAQRTVTPRGELTDYEQTTIDIYRKASPSVVHIVTVRAMQDSFSFRVYEVPSGMGSGFVWDDAGHIVTNLHVINDASRASVTLPDNSVWQARLVGKSDDLDLAVLKIDAPARLLQPIPLGTSNDLQVGQYVLAIGNPFGLDQTLTTGVISGLGRQIPVEPGPRRAAEEPSIIADVIQTDAAINPGNSGGPLLDSAGRLIGVNTQIYSPSGAYAGVGFAIPVDQVSRAVPRLIDTGFDDRPGLGVSLAPDSIVELLVSRGALPRRGALVRSVIQGTGAAEAGVQGFERRPNGGLQLGDLIIEIGGEDITGAQDVYRVLDAHTIGDTLEIRAIRDGKVVSYSITLKALPVISSD